MPYTSDNDKYIIRPDETGFLHLSLVDPSKISQNFNEEKSSEDLLINWYNDNNDEIPEKIPAITSLSTRIPTYQSISGDDNFFRNYQDILRKNITVDVVIIPSGGLHDSGIPYEPVLARLDAAAKLDNVTRYYLSSGAYTPLKPVLLNSIGQPITEARSDAVYLVDHHRIAQNKLILEEMSKDTLGNAFFSRTLCSLMNFQTVVVVTSQFHMLRTRALFDWVFGLFPSLKLSLIYLETINYGMTPEEINAREEKEFQSLQHFWTNSKQKLTSLKDLTHFIYLGHRAYAFNNTVGCYNVTAPKQAFKYY